MNIKKVIKLFIPPVFPHVLKKIKSIKRKADETYISTIGLIEKKSDTICILGNGPSLVESCKKYKDFIVKHDVIGVNLLCVADIYTEMKPSIYVLADPIFFGLGEHGIENEKYKKFVDAFFSKTSWNITVVIPDYAAETEVCSMLKQNDLFNVRFYNTKNLPSDENIFDQYNKNLSTPPARNVLNLSLYLSIFLKYKEVYVFGAENSFMEDIHVDQDDNRLYFTYRHFYDKAEREYLYYDNDHPERGTTKLYEFLSEHSKTMKLYWDLLEYSNYNNVKIYNASEYSLIDAFERKKPE